MKWIVSVTSIRDVLSTVLFPHTCTHLFLSSALFNWFRLCFISVMYSVFCALHAGCTLELESENCVKGEGTICVCVCVCVFLWLTVVCGTGLLLLEGEEEGAVDVGETDESSCITPRLSKTLDSKTRRSVTNCILLVTHQDDVQERDKD